MSTHLLVLFLLINLKTTSKARGRVNTHRETGCMFVAALAIEQHVSSAHRKKTLLVLWWKSFASCVSRKCSSLCLLVAFSSSLLVSLFVCLFVCLFACCLLYVSRLSGKRKEKSDNIKVKCWWLERHSSYYCWWECPRRRKSARGRKTVQVASTLCHREEDDD